MQYIINGVSNKSIRTIAFLSKEHFVWGDAVGNIGLYNLNTRKKNIFKNAHAADIEELVISKNQHIYSASTDKTIKEWYFDSKTQSLKSIRTLKGFFKDTVYGIALSPDNRFIAAGSFDHSVKVIDLKTNKVRDSYIKHAHNVYGVIFSPDGRFVYSCGRDHYIVKYDLHTRHIKKLKGHENRIYYLRFTSNGKFLGSSSRDNTIRLWNRNDQCIAILKGHKQRIYQFAFFDNDTKIASVSWDKIINIWDISSLSENSDCTTILKPERTLKEFPGCEILSFKDKVLQLSDGTILDTSKIKLQIEKLKKQCQVTLQNNTQFIHYDNMFDAINWPPRHPFLDQYQS